jgi:flagellar hook-associated protein 2
LRGDFTARTVESTLQQTISSEVSGLSSSLTALSRIGITSSASDGTLSIDDTKLTSALTSNLTDVKDLFIGLTDDLTTKLDSFTDPYDGLIASRIEGTQDTIDDLQDRMDAMEVRVSQREEQLRAQFQAMETALAQLQTQSAFLAQQSTIYYRSS